MKREIYDVVIIGGSIGGTLAAYQAAKAGYKVVLTEETAWIGGQLTNQGVPSDEHRFIEEFGCTKSYRQYRERVREYYRNHPYIIDEIKNKKIFNPGEGWVSKIAHEPRVALHIFNEMLLPFINNETLVIKTNHKAISTKKTNDLVEEVVVENLLDKEQLTLIGKFVIDGTDLGELLPLTGTEYVTGSEGNIYNEPHATDVAIPEDMQPITWICAVSYHEGEDHTIPKPEKYDYFKSIKMHYAKDVDLLSWYGPTLAFAEGKRLYKFNGYWDKEGVNIPPLFSYRQVVNAAYYKDEYKIYDTTLINWPQNDYIFGNIFDDLDAVNHKYMSRQLTLSLVYWLQTEAPRDDQSGFGYPGLKLRGDVLGTIDGLAMAPYIRESRRIKAKYTVIEQDISAKCQPKLPHFWDTVGIGCYHIDLHMTTKTKSYYFENTWPFEIPLGALIPVSTKNLIPACKNIGTTHITNGCFRLHPVEWNIGEAAGLLATYCLNYHLTPAELYENKTEVKNFQNYLVNQGIELHWPEDKVNAI
ncbi:MAG: dependent oxidoreductase [Haloplasmataceae bacterium]|jgi:hypothetical protein|nr:dependent oxidoreductase [Haloplasmataceae bacterium]